MLNSFKLGWRWITERKTLCHRTTSDGNTWLGYVANNDSQRRYLKFFHWVNQSRKFYIKLINWWHRQSDDIYVPSKYISINRSNWWRKNETYLLRFNVWWVKKKLLYVYIYNLCNLFYSKIKEKEFAYVRLHKIWLSGSSLWFPPFGNFKSIIKLPSFAG